MARSARCRPASVRSRCSGSGCATAAALLAASASASPRPSCRAGRVARAASMRGTPVLYLRGLSMGDGQEALGALLGKEAPNLSPSVVARLRAEWEADDARWQKRDLSARRYVYVWADGIDLQARMEPQAECMLRLDRRHARGQAGTARRPSGRAGQHTKLARTAGRSQNPRPGDRARTGHRRWRTGLLDGHRAGLASDPAAALHGAQERQRHGQDAQIRAARGHRLFGDPSAKQPAAPPPEGQTCARSGRRPIAPRPRPRWPRSPTRMAPSMTRRSSASSRTAARC